MPRLIDANAMIKHFELHAKCAENARCFSSRDAWEGAMHDLQDAETIDAEPVRHGRWERMDEYCNHSKTFRCSVCKSDVEYSHFTRFCEYDYCPNCGARMDLEVQEDA